MNKKQRTSESGQALVLMALAMVVLLGFAALAIDGSMVYSDRRFTQSAADASSLAGGAVAAQKLEDLGVSYSTWTANPPNCSGNVATAATAGRAAAVKRAKDNDFAAFDQDDSDGMGVHTECGVENINVTTILPGGKTGTFTLFQDRFIDVRSTTTRETSTAFAHFVYKGVMQNTTTAITRVRPRQPLAYGFAIVALNSSACSGNSNGIQFRGNLTLNVTGGGVFSNGCLDVDGGNHPVIKNGGVAYFFPGNGLGNIQIVDSNGNPTGASPSQLQNNSSFRIPPEAYDVAIPDCTGHVVSPSALYGRTDLTGLYCVDGDLKVNNAKEGFSGNNVTLVFRGGKVDMSGGNVNITAPPADYTGAAIPGVAIYMPKLYYGTACGEVNQELKLNGNGAQNVTGTILAPCSDISVEGGANTFAFKSQVIGYNVNTGGTADINVVYNANQQHSRPSYIDLHR